MVRLVQSSGSVGSLRSNGFFFFFFLLKSRLQSHLQGFFFDLDFGDVQLIDVCWTLVSGMQDGFLNLLQQ